MRCIPLCMVSKKQNIHFTKLVLLYRTYKGYKHINLAISFSPFTGHFQIFHRNINIYFKVWGGHQTVILILKANISLSLLWLCGPMGAMASSFLTFLDHTQQCITVHRTPLDAWSACLRDLYLTTHNTHNRQPSMPSVGFEPTISEGEWLQTYALDCSGTETSKQLIRLSKYTYKILWLSRNTTITKA